MFCILQDDCEYYKSNDLHTFWRLLFSALYCPFLNLKIKLKRLEVESIGVSFVFEINSYYACQLFLEQ